MKRSREANDKGGKGIIIDAVNKDKKNVVDDDDELMMVMCNGKERNQKDWKKPFLDSGFSHNKITAT